MNYSYNNLMLLPSERRTLRKMRRNNRMPASEIPNVRELYAKGLICPNYTGELDSFNCAVPDGTYRLDDGYWRYIESRKWLTPEFVLRNLLVPIVVGIASAVITRFLIGS